MKQAKKAPIKVPTPESRKRKSMLKQTLEKNSKKSFMICTICGTKIPRTDWSANLHLALLHSSESQLKFLKE
eukprot:gene4013-7269_t